MKCLLLHCKNFSYTLDHPTPAAEDDEPGRHEEFRDALVVFFAFERDDPDNSIDRAALEIERTALKLRVQSVALNAFVHLTNRPASATDGKIAGRLLYQRLVQDGISVEYAPFGWYKEFVLDVFGHGESQSFREFA